MNVRNMLSVGIAAIAIVAIPAFTTNLVAQSMNGSWEVTGGTLHGTAIPANVAFTMTIQVAGNTFVANSGNMNSAGTVTANLQASPQQVTFKIDTGNDPGRELRGIYKFEGQAMTITFSETDQFPDTFESTADNKYLTLNYQIGTGRNTGGVAGNRRGTQRNITTPPGQLPKTTDGNSSAAAF